MTVTDSSYPSPTNNRLVTDIQYETLGSTQAPSGLLGYPGGTAPVYADSTGKQVKLRPGLAAWVRGHVWQSDPTGDILIPVPGNTSGNPRQDRLVLGLDRSTWNVTAYVKVGTPSATPTPPDLQQDTGTTGKYEIPLARWQVANNFTTIAPTDVVLEGWYVSPDGTILCTSTTRPWGLDVKDGSMVYETDTQRHNRYLASAGGWTGIAVGSVDIRAAATTDSPLRIGLAGEPTKSRLSVKGDGTIYFGDGVNAADSSITRLAAYSLRITGKLTADRHDVQVTAGNSTALAILQPTDSAARFFVDGNGTLYWGPGGASSQDVSVGRSSFGPWIDFSGAFNIGGSITNPTKGNSIYTARYQQMGKTTYCTFYVNVGTTFAPGSGSYFFSLPVPAVTSVFATGAAYMLDNGVAHRTGVVGVINANQVMIYRPDQGSELGSTGPGSAWKNGSVIKASIIYEAA